MFPVSFRLHSLLAFLGLWLFYSNFWFHCHAAWPLTLLHSSYKNACDSIWGTQIIQGNLFLSRSLIKGHLKSAFCLVRYPIHKFFGSVNNFGGGLLIDLPWLVIQSIKFPKQLSLFWVSKWPRLSQSEGLLGVVHVITRHYLPAGIRVVGDWTNTCSAAGVLPPEGWACLWVGTTPIDWFCPGLRSDLALWK